MKGILSFIAFGILISQSLLAQNSPQDTAAGAQEHIFTFNLTTDDYLQLTRNPTNPQTWESHPVQFPDFKFVGVRVIIAGVKDTASPAVYPKGGQFLPPAKPNGANRIYFNENDIKKLIDGSVSFGVEIPAEYQDNHDYLIFYRPTTDFVNASRQNLAPLKQNDAAFDISDDSFAATGKSPVNASDQSQSTFYDRKATDNRSKFEPVSKLPSSNRESFNAEPNWRKSPQPLKPAIDTNQWPQDIQNRFVESGNSRTNSDNMDQAFRSQPRTPIAGTQLERTAQGTTFERNSLSRQGTGPSFRDDNRFNLEPIGSRTGKENSVGGHETYIAELTARKKRIEEENERLDRLEKEKRRRAEMYSMHRELAQKELALKQRQSRIRDGAYDDPVTPESSTVQVQPIRERRGALTSTGVGDPYVPDRRPTSDRYASRDTESLPALDTGDIDPPERPFVQNNQIASTPIQNTKTAENTSEPQSSQSDRMNLLLLLMFLGSTGLNVFLGWISRGFYVRYHDLADELRETFNVTSGN